MLRRTFLASLLAMPAVVRAMVAAGTVAPSVALEVARFNSDLWAVRDATRHRLTILGVRAAGAARRSPPSSTTSAQRNPMADALPRGE